MARNHTGLGSSSSMTTTWSMMLCLARIGIMLKTNRAVALRVLPMTANKPLNLFIRPHVRWFFDCWSVIILTSTLSERSVCSTAGILKPSANTHIHGFHRLGSQGRTNECAVSHAYDFTATRSLPFSSLSATRRRSCQEVRRGRAEQLKQ